MNSNPYSARSRFMRYSAGLAIAATEAHPHIKATVVEFPSITPITQKMVDEAGASDRVEVMASDVVSEGLPGTYDAAALSQFIQVLTPNEAQNALGHISQALNPGGQIFIRGLVLDNSRITPPEIAGWNLYFLNNFRKGSAYTEQEYRDWLAEAGFVDFERTLIPGSISWVRARKLA